MEGELLRTVLGLVLIDVGPQVFFSDKSLGGGACLKEVMDIEV